jgi:hypothetical protein
VSLFLEADYAPDLPWSEFVAKGKLVMVTAFVCGSDFIVTFFYR